jgi:hypothetical protein
MLGAATDTTGQQHSLGQSLLGCTGHLVLLRRTFDLKIHADKYQ